jgi:hypothetical protein
MLPDTYFSSLPRRPVFAVHLMPEYSGARIKKAAWLRKSDISAIIINGR